MTTAINTSTIHNSRPFGSRFLEGVVGFFTAIAEASGPAQCAREAERLFAMSDAELAKRGLTRDTVVQHAFKSYLHF